MAITVPTYIDPRAPSGYGRAQPLPITGATPAPQGSTPDNEDPPDKPINDWLRAQPWYHAALQAWGVDPNHIVLSATQRAQLADAARRAGLQLGSSHDIGPDGGFEDVHSTASRNIGLTIGGVAGGVGALGATGVLGGAEAGGVGLGETAATTGLATGAGLPGAIAAPVVGDLAGVGSSIAGVGGAGSTLGTIGNVLGQTSTIGKIADLAGLAGTGIADATKSAGQTQQSNVNTGLTANAQNISGQNAFENQLLARAKDEEAQRGTALKNVYRNSIATNPRTSPYNPAGPSTYSPEYLSTLAGLSGQGAKTLSAPGQYDTSKLPPLKPYTPYDPNSMSGPGGTQPSTMQTVGNWLAPTLSTISAIAKILGH